MVVTVICDLGNVSIVSRPLSDELSRLLIVFNHQNPHALSSLNRLELKIIRGDMELTVLTNK